ncbi:MAG: GNAT family N-acetyltransferase [Pseudomonadota bacterium]
MLRTERFLLRRPAPQDLHEWTPFYKSARAVHIGGGPDASDGRAWRTFASIIGHWTLNGCGPFAIALDDESPAIGMAGPWFPGDWPEREMSWSIWAPRWEGRGAAFEAVTAARAHAFDDLGWSTAVSYVDPRNARSIALAERLGCVRDGEAAKPDALDALVYRHPAPTRG